MRARLRRVHLAAGFLLLAIFPLTGAYLRLRVPHLMQQSDRLRFSMRGNHIYILLSSLIHLPLGAYLRPGPTRWRGRLQTIGSILLLVSSVLVVAAFLYESKERLERPVTSLAMVMAAAGVLLHVFCAMNDGSQK